MADTPRSGTRRPPKCKAPCRGSYKLVTLRPRGLRGLGSYPRADSALWPVFLAITGPEVGVDPTYFRKHHGVSHWGQVYALTNEQVAKALVFAGEKVPTDPDKAREKLGKRLGVRRIR